MWGYACRRGFRGAWHDAYGHELEQYVALDRRAAYDLSTSGARESRRITRLKVVGGSAWLAAAVADVRAGCLSRGILTFCYGYAGFVSYTAAFWICALSQSSSANHLSSEARKQPARGKAIQYLLLGVRIRVKQRRRIHDRHGRVTTRVHDRRLVWEAPAPARRDVDRTREHLGAREDPLEVARARAVADPPPGRREGRRGVVDLYGDARGQDRACGGVDEGAREVGG